MRDVLYMLSVLKPYPHPLLHQIPEYKYTLKKRIINK